MPAKLGVPIPARFRYNAGRGNANMMRHTLGLALLTALTASAAITQTNVLAVHANGQTFVVWKVGSPLPITYEIYRSSTPFTDTSQATLAGRLFRTEWEGSALDQISGPLTGSNTTWVIPDGMGGTVQLPEDRGLFVYTPHGAATEYFAIVPTGTTTVTAANITPSPVVQTYDPANDPVRAHLQLSGISPEGFQFRVYTFWTDGSDDIEDARPDFPITGNSAKNGMPNVFAVYAPLLGPGDAPYPMTFAVHGGQGNFHLFRPGIFPNIGLDIDDGILVAPHDSLYIQIGSTVAEATTAWLGYATTLDPFDVDPNADPPPGTVVADYTQRKFNWIREWILEGGDYGFEVDPTRISLIGHSAGGQGVGIFARRDPSRYSVCHMFTPALQRDLGPNPFYGSSTLNLETNILGPSGANVNISDVFDWDTPLSQTERDFCLTRIYSGRNDQSVFWNLNLTSEFAACNDSAMGFHLYWDSRGHGIADWDDPPFYAEWVHPIRTERGTARYAQRYRSNQSFPAFFDDDQDPSSHGRQPDIGGGDPLDGDTWGTWSGYYDWDAATIKDSPKVWACTLWLTGLSSVAVDNCPVTVARVSIAVRKPQRFRPPANSPFFWRLKRTDTGAVLMSGGGLTDSSGVVRVRELLIAREDFFRSRLEVQRIPVPVGL